MLWNRNDLFIAVLFQDPNPELDPDHTKLYKILAFTVKSSIVSQKVSLSFLFCFIFLTFVYDPDPNPVPESELEPNAGSVKAKSCGSDSGSSTLQLPSAEEKCLSMKQTKFFGNKQKIYLQHHEAFTVVVI